MSFAVTWMDVETVLLREVRQRRRNMVMTSLRNLKKK